MRSSTKMDNIVFNCDLSLVCKNVALYGDYENVKRASNIRNLAS